MILGTSWNVALHCSNLILSTADPLVMRSSVINKQFKIFERLVCHLTYNCIRSRKAGGGRPCRRRLECFQTPISYPYGRDQIRVELITSFQICRLRNASSSSLASLQHYTLHRVRRRAFASQAGNGIWTQAKAR